jgi:hypothetical protein
MALLDDIVNGGNLVTGLMVGAGVLIGWSLIAPVARPIAKSVIKGGLIAYQQAERLYTGAVEGIGDMVAEAHQEIGSTISTQSRTDGSSSRAT